MERNFLEQESLKANGKRRKLFISLFVFFVCVSIFLYFMTRNAFNLSDHRDFKLAVLFFALAGFMVFCTGLGLVVSLRPMKNGKNLTLPYEEDTKEAVAKIINQEVAQGKVLYEGYMNADTIGKYNDRVILLPSYLLLIENLGGIMAIPRDKIYWLCAQVGRKGGPFYVRLLLFTEEQILFFEGNDVDRIKEIADGLYQYIPNVFAKYDAQELSYSLEKLFRENRDEFWKFYQKEIHMKE